MKTEELKPKDLQHSSYLAFTLFTLRTEWTADSKWFCSHLLLILLLSLNIVEKILKILNTYPCRFPAVKGVNVHQIQSSWLSEQVERALWQAAGGPPFFGEVSGRGRYHQDGWFASAVSVHAQCSPAFFLCVPHLRDQDDLFSKQKNTCQNFWNILYFRLSYGFYIS